MMKIILILLLFTLCVGLPISVWAEAVPQRKTTESAPAKALIDLLPLADYTLLFPSEVSGDLLYRWYRQNYEAGKVPLAIAADSNLLFTIQENIKRLNISDTLAAANSLYSNDSRKEEVPLPSSLTVPESVFSGLDPLLTYGEEWLLATLSADSPWQVLALVPFGGWNDCPLPEEQAATLFGWQQRFGVLPFLMTYDSLVLLVEHPPQSLDESRPLAEELLAFCPDLEMVYESPESLAEALLGDRIWPLWWD